MPVIASLCSLSGCNAQERDSFRSVSAEEFERTIADSTVILVDVRTEQEYDEGHIDGAILIDVLQDDFMERAVELLPEDKPVALYCRSGKRSKRAAAMLAGQGYNVTELSDGYIGWVEHHKSR